MKYKLPSNWKYAKIKEIADIDTETISEDTDPNYRFKYITLGDVNKGKISDELSECSFEEAPSRARRVINIKDVIVSTGFAVISPRECVNGKYLYQFLYSEYIKWQLYTLIVGSSYPAINSDDVANLKILLPPHEEQQKIADIFSLYDFAIKKIEQLIIMKEEYKKAIIQQMFDKRKIVKGINLEISNILSVVKREDDGKKIWELCT